LQEGEEGILVAAPGSGHHARITPLAAPGRHGLMRLHQTLLRLFPRKPGRIVQPFPILPAGPAVALA
jgi:hypothetical protein